MISKQEIEEHNTRVMLERASDEWVTIAAAWDAIPQGFAMTVRLTTITASQPTQLMSICAVRDQSDTEPSPRTNLLV